MKLTTYNKRLFMIGTIVSLMMLPGCSKVENLVGDPVPPVNEELNLNQEDERDLVEMPGYTKRWNNEHKSTLRDEIEFLTANSYLLPLDLSYSLEEIETILDDVTRNDKNTERVTLANETKPLVEDLANIALNPQGLEIDPSTNMESFNLRTHEIKDKILTLQEKVNSLINIKDETKDK